MNFFASLGIFMREGCRISRGIKNTALKIPTSFCNFCKIMIKRELNFAIHASIFNFLFRSEFF